MRTLWSLLLLGMTVACHPVNLSQSSHSLIGLPADPESVVLTLDYVGGGPQFPPVSPGPHLTIRAGGRVTVNDPQGKAKKVDGTIRKDELQSLLQFAIEERRFFLCDDRAVREAIQKKEKSKELFRAFDMPYPIIRITTAARDHQASIYPVSPPVGKAWPSTPELTLMRGLGDLESRLRQLMARVWVGGESEVNAAVLLANDYLLRRIPGAAPLTAEHLWDARQWVDGRVEIRFYRPGSKPKRGIEIRIEKRPENSTTVVVEDDDA